MKSATRWVCLLALVFVCQRLAAAEEHRMQAPALDHDVWKCYQRDQWHLTQGAAWVSLGHLARVLCFVPESVNADGDVSLDGLGLVHTIHLEAHEVLAFAEDGQTPVRTRLLERLSVRADDPDCLLPLEPWSFRLAYKSYHHGSLDDRPHQMRRRLFLHNDSQMLQTLLLRTQAEVAEIPHDQRHGLRTHYYPSFDAFVMVFEMLRADALPPISRMGERFELTDPHWIERQTIKAPWALQRASLAPVRGRLLRDEQGTMIFAPVRQSMQRPSAPPTLDQPSAPAGPQLQKPPVDIDNLLD